MNVESNVQRPLGFHIFNKYTVIVLYSVGEAWVLLLISKVCALNPSPVQPPALKPLNPTEKHFLIKSLFIYLIGI